MPRSISLSRSNARRCAETVGGVPADRPHDLLARQRAARVEQQREQVEDAFDAARGVRHRGEVTRRPARRARRSPAAAAALEEHGVVGRVCGPSKRCAGRARRSVRRCRTVRRRRRRGARRGRRPRGRARMRCSSVPPTAGSAIVARLRQATVSAVTVWWETPRWRSRGSANETRSAAIGKPAEAGGGVEDLADLDAGEAEAGRGADDARPHHDDGRVRVRDVLRDGERAEYRDRFVVAAERMPVRDRRVEQVAGAQGRRRGPTGRAAMPRRRSSRTRGACGARAP